MTTKLTKPHRMPDGWPTPSSYGNYIVPVGWTEPIPELVAAHSKAHADWFESLPWWRRWWETVR